MPRKKVVIDLKISNSNPLQLGERKRIFASLKARIRGD